MRARDEDVKQERDYVSPFQRGIGVVGLEGGGFGGGRLGVGAITSRVLHGPGKPIRMQVRGETEMPAWNEHSALPSFGLQVQLTDAWQPSNMPGRRRWETRAQDGEEKWR